MTPEYAYQQNPDAIIAALGATPSVPSIPGVEGPNVLAAQDAYAQLDRVGKSVVILGAGLVGVELGLHLISNGRNVRIIEMLDHISDGGNFLHILGLNAEIKKRGLEIDFNEKATEITPTCVTCESNGIEKTYCADTIVYAVGQTPARREAIALAACAPEFHMLGDCVSTRNITDATAEAYYAARNIGRL